MKMIGERNSEPDIILLKIIQSEQQREKRLEKKKEQNLRVWWNNSKRYSICVIRLSVGDKKMWCWKNVWRNNGWKLNIFGERHIPTKSQSGVNSR